MNLANETLRTLCISQYHNEIDALYRNVLIYRYFIQQL